MKESNNDDVGNFSSLLTVVRTGSPRFRIIAFAILISLLEVGSTLWFPILTKDLIDSLSSAELRGSEIIGNPTVQLLIVVISVGAGAGAISAYLLAKAGLEVVARLKTKLVECLMGQRVAYFDDRRSGGLVSRITNDTDVIAKVATTDIQHFINGILLLVGSAVVLALLDIRLTLAIFGIILGPIYLASLGSAVMNYHHQID